MGRSKCLRKLVCVEHEQYDQVQDTLLAVRGKLTFIVNGFDSAHYPLKHPPKKDENLVVYLGALVPRRVPCFGKVLAQNSAKKTQSKINCDRIGATL